jgi:hypothetical protein
MNSLRIEDAPTHTDIDWTPFPGGELEGQRPKALCPACRARRQDAEGRASAPKAALCFQCYRLEIEQIRKVREAAELNTASEARFQECLPFEPVNTSRLVQLKAEREQVRKDGRQGSGGYAERRRRAQIEARHALARIVKGLKERKLVDVSGQQQPVRRPVMDSALIHAAELQLPEAWLPFVVSR